jgi:thiol-disulfide isomerase/thioredoxin
MMKRREFLVLSAAAVSATALPGSATAAPLEYVPGMLDEQLDAGKTVFLDFKASWCGTCAAQERVLAKLKSENPAYEANIVFIDIDWDVYGKSQMAEKMRIPRRSTLVALKGDKEIGRIVAETREARIKELMDAALAEATGA